MSVIILPGKFRTLPQKAAAPRDRRGACINSSVTRELVGRNSRSDPTGSFRLTRAISPYGPVWSATGRDYSDAYPINITGVTDYTAYLYFLFADAADAFQYVLGATTAGTNFGITAAHNSISGHWGHLAGSTFIDSNENLPRNQFTAIVVTRKGSAIKLFRDGQLKNTGSESTTHTAITNIVLNSYDAASGFGAGGGTKFAIAGIDPYAWSDGEVRNFCENPFSIFKAPTRRLVAVAPPAGTVSISGVSAATSTGILTPSTELALPGQSLSAASGTITPSLAQEVALSGQVITASSGTLTPAIEVALSGQAVVASHGSVVVEGSPDVALTLSGQSIVAAQGSLEPSTSVALSGQSATASLGSLSVDREISISGQSLSSAQGSLSPVADGETITIELTGQSLSIRQTPFSLEEFIWDTDSGLAARSRGTFRPLKSEVSVIPDEEVTFERDPIENVEPKKLVPIVGLNRIKFNFAARPKAEPVGKDYKSMMLEAGRKETSLVKISNYKFSTKKQPLTKVRDHRKLRGVPPT